MKKAEERKENETNSLRLWLEHAIERLKGRALYTVVGSIVLAIAVVFVVWYWTSSRATAKSARLLEFTQADTEKKLNEIISSDNHQNKPTAVWAKLEKARIVLYRDGIDRLGAQRKEDHIAAVDKVEEGRKLYSDIVNDLKDEFRACSRKPGSSMARAEEVADGDAQGGQINGISRLVRRGDRRTIARPPPSTRTATSAKATPRQGG